MNEDRRNDETAPIEEQLEQILADAESAIARVREELAEQRAEATQHEEVDRLPEHLQQATVRWGEVKAFFEDVVRDLRERRGSGGK